jgi:hypothetical protein
MQVLFDAKACLMAIWPTEAHAELLVAAELSVYFACAVDSFSFERI